MSVQKYSKEQIENAVQQSSSWRQTLAILNPNAKYTGSESNLKKRAIYYGVNFSHFPGKGWNIGLQLPFQYQIEDYFNGKGIRSNQLKRRLFSEGIKQVKCEKCNLEEWLENKIPLELHHIDRNPLNNKLDNLKILCPNCHHLEHVRVKVKKARPHKYNVREKVKVEKTKKPLDNSWRHRPRIKTRKVNRPSLAEIEGLQNSHSMVAIGKMFGVTCNSIRKWIKWYKETEGDHF